MRNKKDITGKKFGRLTALSEVQASVNGKIKWVCVCECGKRKEIFKTNIISGKSKSCGCLQKECVSMANKKRKVHGALNTGAYKSWKAMNQRCCNPNNESYDNYGGRGIRVCERWLNSFENFYADMGDRPKGKSLDRIDNDRKYCPENCKWSSAKEQSNNRRNSIVLTLNGESKTMSEWSRLTGIKYITIWTRIKKYNWPVSKALTP